MLFVKLNSPPETGCPFLKTGAFEAAYTAAAVFGKHVWPAKLEPGVNLFSFRKPPTLFLKVLQSKYSIHTMPATNIK
jgi:hypothetical protein